MNYIEWSREYEQTAYELEQVIERLKRERRSKSKSERQEIDDRIAFYRQLRGECLSVSAHLRARDMGVA